MRPNSIHSLESVHHLWASCYLKRYPDRIRNIYIRSIDQNPRRTAAIDKLISEVGNTGSQLILAPDTEYAAVHAAGGNIISTDALADIREEKKSDVSRQIASDNVDEGS